MAFENNVQATLQANVAIGATTVDVVKAVAPNKDVPVSGRLTLSATGKTEIISYTGRTDNTTYWTLTGVTKNAESSFGDQAWSAGDACFQALTAADVANFTTVHSATAPTNPTVGTKWFNTTTGVLQEYLSDGTDSAWLDISSGTTIGTAATTTAAIIAPVAQGYINSENSGTAAGCSYTYSAGTTTVTFNTAMADTNYSVITDKEGFDEHQVLTGSKTLTSFVMQSRDSAGTNVMSPASWPYSFVVYASDPVQSVVATSGGSFQSTNTLADGASVTHALGFAHNGKSIVQLRELIAGTTSVNSNWDFDTGDSALWSGNGTFSGGVLTLNEVTAGVSVTQIATNGAHSLAVLSNGTVKGTGTNSTGQLGLGNNTNQTSWVLTGLSNITAVAMGDVHSLALNSSGSLFLTGSGSSGRTGFNSTNYNVWTNSGLSNVVSMDGGSEFSLAVLSDGTVKATGNNGRGQLGMGNNTRQWVWATSTITNVAKIFTGGDSSYALLNDGTVKVAGYNGYGALGIGNNTHQSTWQSTSLANVTKISPNQNNSLALISDGTVKAAGTNTYGNLLFSGSTANTWTTSTITGVSDIAIGSYHSIFIVGGVVKVVGRNNVGQLGLGDNTDRSVLTNTALTGASFISANGNNIDISCFVGFSNGTYKGTGTNGTGALGLGNTTFPFAWTTTAVGTPPVYAASTAVESLSALDTSGGNLSITNVDITNTAPTNTGILYALSFDNKTTWTSDMTETAIEAFDFSGVTLGTTAHVKITMTTTDTSVSPSVDQISLSLTTQGYLARTTPSPTTYVVIDSGTQDVVITNNTGSTKTIRADISQSVLATSSSGLASTVASTDPLITSNPSAVGHVWVNSTTGQAYICTDISTNINVWNNIGIGTANISASIAATGGTVTTVGGYKIHTFTTSSNFVVTSAGSVDYIIVAGGGAGGGGRNNSGGGGAGGMLVGTSVNMTVGTHAITVGAGGSASNNTFGGSGQNSLLGSFTTLGGGGGGSHSSTFIGQAGGSGGGASQASYAGGAGTSGQGNSGGGDLFAAGGGGGGKGAAAFTGSGGSSYTHGAAGVAGGVGLSSSISGSAVFYAGGGGGGQRSAFSVPQGAGGNGGGGNGGLDTGSGFDGAANTGGGGGGAGGNDASLRYGGAGGSGIVIVRYAV